MEHLRDDDDGDGRTVDSQPADRDGGTTTGEIVQEQVETHVWEGAEHSKVHLGELFWEKDPTDDSDTPSPSMTFEVDYYAGADPALDTPAWRRSIEDNFELYGIDVTMQRDEVLTDNDLVRTSTLIDARGNPVRYDVYNFTEPFNESDLSAIEDQFHTPGTEYLFVASVADRDIPGGASQTGIHRWRGLPFFVIQRYTTVFTDAHTAALGTVPNRLGLSRDEKMRAVTAKTAVHEVGHVLDLGEEDDRDGEIYSGSTRRGEEDRTPESVENTNTNFIVEDWSLMSRGINGDNFLPPTYEDFTAISIEEWGTMNDKLD